MLVGGCLGAESDVLLAGICVALAWLVTNCYQLTAADLLFEVLKAPNAPVDCSSESAGILP